MIHKRLILIPISLMLLALFQVGCADDPEPVQRDLLLRVYNAEGGMGFPQSILSEISTIRVRIYENGNETRIKTYDYGEPSGVLPRLEFGNNYQLIVEALDATDTVLADGATNEFDYFETTALEEVFVFVSELGSLEYASALYKEGDGDIVSAPTEFEGPEVAQRLGMGSDSEELGGQRTGHTATRLEGGKILVVGGARMSNSDGIDGSPFANFVDTIEVFDPDRGYWTLLKDSAAEPVVNPNNGNVESAPMRLSVARAFHTTTLLDDGRLLVVGGFYDAGGWIETSGAVEIIDLENETIEVLGLADMLITPRALHTAHNINDSVVVIGGVTGRYESPSYLNGIEAFDQSSERFDLITDADSGQVLELAVSRAMHSGTTISDGIIVAGGRSGDATVTDTVEFLELHSGTLSSFFGSNPQVTGVPRFAHSAVLMEEDFSSEESMPAAYIALAGGFSATQPDGDVVSLLEGAEITDSVQYLDSWLLEVNSGITNSLRTPRAHFQMAETSITRDLIVSGGLVQSGQDLIASSSVERLWRNYSGGFPLTVGEQEPLNSPRAFGSVVSLLTHNVMVVGGWEGTSDASVCGSSTITAGCTSEIFNPGDLFYLGYLY